MRLTDSRPVNNVRGEKKAIRIITKKRELKMVNLLDHSQTLLIISNICQKYGCEIKKIDLEKHVLDIEGPPAAQEKCAEELEAFLD